MSDGKLSLNLNEENELTFKILIEGTTTDANINKPNIRFALTEKGNKQKAWLYQTKKDDDGNVVVSISGEKHLSEKKEYVGQLEVILGNHYFVPTTVDIEFIRPLKVEAAVVVKNPTLQEGNKNLGDAGVTVSSSPAAVRTKVKGKKASNAVKVPVAKKRSWDELSLKEQTTVKKILRERKLKELREAKKLSEKKETREEYAEKIIKEQFKSLLGDSLLED